MISGPANNSTNAGQAGAVDAELFLQAFEDVKPLTFHNARTLQVVTKEVVILLV